MTRGLSACVLGLFAGIGWLGVEPQEKGKAGSPEPSSIVSRSCHFTLCVAYAPDGRTLASVGVEGALTLWDLSTGRSRLVARRNGLRFVAFAPDGRTLAALDLGPEVVVLDVATGELRGTLESPRKILAAAHAPDGRTLATANEGGTITVWDLATHRPKATLPRPAAGDRPVAFSSLTADVAFAPDGLTLASGASDGRILIWDVESGGLARWFQAHDRPIRSLAFAPDGKTLASAACLDPIGKLWDPRTGAPRAALRGHRHGIASLAFSPDGCLLASAGGDGDVKMWDAASGRERSTLRGHLGWLWSVAFAPDGTRLASGGADGSIRLWELPDGSTPRSLSLSASVPCALVD